MSTNKNLPSTTTMPSKAAGERGGGFPTTYKEENNQVKEAVEDLLDVTRPTNKEIHDDDVENVIKVTESLLKQSYKNEKTRKMYTRYQNLWNTFAAKEMS